MRDLTNSSVSGPDGAAALLAAIAAIAGDRAHPRVRVFLEHVGRELAVDLAAVESSHLCEETDPAALAERVVDDAREAVVQRLVLAAMLVPPVTAARLDRLEAHARALGRAKEPALVDLRRLLAGRRAALTAGLMRRFPPNERMKRAWRSGGLGDRWRMIKALLRLPDAATAARYRALGELPEGTLGRVFFDHCRRGGFPLPGERVGGRVGLPEAAVFHDMGHALLGLGTDLLGETRIAGFEAGTMGDRGFVMLEFTLLLFNLGAPLPTDARPQVDAVDLAELLAAFARGRAGRLDVIAWDPWADVEAPVSALRARYAVAAWG